MIFVSVGSQLPFDRLVRMVSDWKTDSGYVNEIIVQTGKDGISPSNLKCQEFISADKFVDIFSESEFVISHAGMGNIIAALEIGKPILIVPRDSTLGEHRNNHQMATANKFKDKSGVYVAYSDAEFRGAVDKILKSKNQDSSLNKPDELGGFVKSKILEWFNV